VKRSPGFLSAVTVRLLGYVVDKVRRGTDRLVDFAI
jgi:hypothetical protein